VGCDGAKSITRQLLNITTESLLPPQKFISVVFHSHDVKTKMTMPKGVLYYNLNLPKTAAIGCTDFANGIWYAQIAYSGEAEITAIDISGFLEQITGFKFQKEIKHANFWNRQALLANHFQKGKIFLAGDAAHVLPPTGGHGVNTGFGDAVNLAWKLHAVIGNHASEKLLSTYEMERRPIAIRNLYAAKKNAEDANQIRTLYPPEIMPENFAKENQRIAQQHAVSVGLALGYRYHASPIILYEKDNFSSNDLQNYQPIAAAGFFAPHYNLSSRKCLYDILNIGFTLLTNEKVDNKIINAFAEKGITLSILQTSSSEMKKLYPRKFYLLRPDWHIAWVGDKIPNDLISFVTYLMP
jgi:hypothetical protein